ncbi:MAG: DUF882 domain-containing protein [Burkholderiaceae bacterium]
MPVDSSRRIVVAGVALTGFASIALPTATLANQLGLPSGSRALTLHNVWTKKDTTFLLGRNEPFRREWVQELNFSLRDHHNGRVGKMDPELVTHLMDIQDVLGLDNPTFEILSAYRSRQTQARLRRNGERVANESMHLKGRALDIRIRGVLMRDLRDAALDLKTGGVGSYHRFVHFDTGPRRRW